MDWIKKRTHIIDHEKFLAAGPIARDLYDWGLLWSGEHETDGEIPMVAVLCSAWGAGGKTNIRPATKLVEVGLWERTDTGFRSLKWAEQGNMTAAQLVIERAAARARKAARGSGKVQANAGRTNAEVPTSTSLSLSGYGSPSQIASPPEVPPPWFDSVLDVLEANVDPVRLPAAEAWLRYDGHRAGKGIEPTPKDAQYWLTTVMIAERRKARDEAHHREKRDRDFDAKRRFAKDGPEKPPPPTREQSQAFADELARRITADRKVGT